MSSHIRKNEKGIALLFTLGILAVLLVVALAFATSSITERKAAANNAELTSARLLAESAVQRAIAGLRWSDALTPTAAYDKMFSHEPSATSLEPSPNNMESFDTLWRLATIKDYVNYYTWNPGYVATSSSAVHWQYIHDTSDITNGRILGRIAYFVTASGGKLDPSMCVSHEKDDVTTPTTDANGMTLDAATGVSYPRGTADDESTVIEERNGKYVCEINIKNLYNNASGYLDTPTVKKMSTTTIIGAGGGLLADRTRWTDFDTFVNAFTLPALSNNQKSKFKDWFIVSPSSRDEERFWIDTNSNGLQDTGEWYHRFNIARTDWGTNTALQGTAGVTTLTGAAVPYVSGVFSEDGTNGTNAIQWLSKFGKDPATGLDDDLLYKASFTSVADRRNQIAANIIDYCDSDTATTPNATPTTDYSEVAGYVLAGTGTCTYMGNERTPRINEVVIGLHAVVTNTGGNTTTSLKVGAIVGGELINIYGDDFNSAATLTVSYSVTGTVTFAGGGTPFASPYSRTFASPGENTASITLSTNGYFYSATDYETTSPFYDGTSTLSSDPSPTVSFTGVSVTIREAKLTYNGQIVDYAYLNKTLDPIDIIDTATNNTDQIAYFGGIQCDDPRQHLFPGEWSNGSPSGPGTGYLYGTTRGAAGTPPNPNPSTGVDNGQNYNVTMSISGKDTETGELSHVDDPSYNFTAPKPRLSTAYIRNAPMQSPWEIGFIHRGAKWETINLTKYNKDDNNDGTEASTEFGVTLNMGGRAYEKGDANILDQIKMTHDTDQGFGKINIRACNLDSLRALIGYIKYGSTFPVASYSTAMPGANGTILDYDTTSVALGTASALTNIANAINGSDKRPFITRAQVANVSKLTDGTEITQNTDAQKEEIIGKFINLTNANIADEFTIVAIAQSIKDIGGPSSGTGIRISKDVNGDGVVSSFSKGTSADSGYYWDGTSKTTAAVLGSFDETNISSCRIGQYDLGADEILSEQKILCVVKKSSTGKWEIVRYEYVE